MINILRSFCYTFVTFHATIYYLFVLSSTIYFKTTLNHLKHELSYLRSLDTEINTAIFRKCEDLHKVKF